MSELFTGTWQVVYADGQKSIPSMTLDVARDYMQMFGGKYIIKTKGIFKGIKVYYTKGKQQCG